MAGNRGGGPAPKPPGQRRRYNQPARSEWVDLKPLTEPILPPDSGHWSNRARRLWRAWRQDPVTSQWGAADIAYARELCEQFEHLQPSEQRLRIDALGLTPKGKRDLRWRTPAEVKTIAEQETQVPVKRLRVVDEEAS